MEININKIPTDFNGEYCYVHARGVILPSGFGIITMQKLLLSGCDVFYGLEMIKTEDFGKSFSAPTPCKNLGRRYFEDGTSFAMCDATPFYHKKTGKIILTGHIAHYGKDNKLLTVPRRRQPFYAVYNELTADFDAPKFIEMSVTEKDDYFSSGAGCAQILEKENGEILIPIYYKSKEEAKDPTASSSTSVMRCAFDGQTISILEIGNSLTTSVPRGLGEPSIVYHNGKYLLAIRNDESGYVSESCDGLHFSPPRILSFDDGNSLGNYNTQQHWIVGGGKLWLVYTRRAENNNHIFRHRAPLFIAEFDTVKMAVVRSSEKIAVPERGARLGNFGCQSYSQDTGYVYASEWMQNDESGWQGCVKRGSDNSIFISKISF